MATQGRETQWRFRREWTGRKALGRAHPYRLSPWSQSLAKRCFDLALVVVALPIAVPACIIMGVAVFLASPGPVFFLQKRKGLGGRLFSIVKFRTMVHPGPSANGSITTAGDDCVTSLGRILRHWKLDELPQLWNVLRGDMSLVGPRPRVPNQPSARMECRPGITGAASLVFVREELLLARIPQQHREHYYATRVIPIKQRLDDEYMARATLLSDFRLLLLTMFRIWMAPDLRTVDSSPANQYGNISSALPERSSD